MKSIKTSRQQAWSGSKKRNRLNPQIVSVARPHSRHCRCHDSPPPKFHIIFNHVTTTYYTLHPVRLAHFPSPPRNKTVQADRETVFLQAFHIAKHDRATQKEASSASQDSPNSKISRHDCRLRDLTTMALLKTAAVFRNISRARSRVAQQYACSQKTLLRSSGAAKCTLS